MTDISDAQTAAEAALARVDAQIAQAQAHRAGIDQIAEEITGITATARSPQREITAEAQSGGRVLSIEVTDAALRLSPRRLSQLLTETVAAAQHEAAMAAVARGAEVLGADSPLVTELRKDAAAAFPAAGSPSGGIEYG